MNRSPVLRLLAAGTLALVVLAAPSAYAGPFGALYVFGDSLSDSGNNASVLGTDPGQVVTGKSYVPTNPYAAGTYSNGPVWASYFANALGVPLAPSFAGGGDFAFGGATTGAGSPLPSLLAQTGQYLGATGGVASANALYVIAGGGNNARAALGAMAAQPANALAIAAGAAASFAAAIGAMVDRLQAAGAQHIVVWNTPNLGVAPAVASSGFGGTGSFLAGLMNGALDARLSGEAGVSTFDLFGFGSQIAADPAAYGFADVTDACGAIANANCSQYAYWDGIHPTTAAHQAIAGAMFVATVPVPEPETYALMAFGLVAVAWGVRRRAKVALTA